MENQTDLRSCSSYRAEHLIKAIAAMDNDGQEKRVGNADLTFERLYLQLPVGLVPIEIDTHLSDSHESTCPQ